MATIFQTNTLRCRLEESLRRPVVVKLNNNSCNFVSIRFDRTKKPISASIHSIFLDAPSEIVDVLAKYIKTKGKDRALTEQLRQYILQAVTERHQHKASKDTLLGECIGAHHDLLQVADEIRRTLLPNAGAFTLSWFRTPRRKRPLLRCSLGLYVQELNLIKINVCLNRSDIPQYVVSLIVYHEMLHAIYPPKIFPSGKKIVHTKEFCQAEQRHPSFTRAEQWLEEHREQFFRKEL